jgi:hypothetical protein
MLSRLGEEGTFRSRPIWFTVTRFEYDGASSNQAIV